MTKTILGVLDNPTTTTGFAIAGTPFLARFSDEGWDVHCLGTLSTRRDEKGELPFAMHPINSRDHTLRGYDRLQDLILTIKPDIIWIMMDAGSVFEYLFGDQRIMEVLKAIKRGDYKHLNIKPFKIVAYIPIEGSPFCSPHMLQALRTVQENGQLVLYSQGSIDVVKETWPECEAEFVHHGLDHSGFRRYTDEERTLLRRYAGLNDRFVVGVFGANKRTKGFPDALYVAKEIMDRGKTNIHFYFHTEYGLPTHDGYYLYQLAKSIGVESMVTFKPDPNDLSRGDMFTGVEASADTIGYLQSLGWPPPPGFYDNAQWVGGVDLTVMGHYDYMARMNTLDLYFDPSAVEGWGLIPGEAMRCGVPVLQVRDNHIRDEIYGEVRIPLDPLPHRLWDTWHTGARLVKFDPVVAADKIIKLSEGPPIILDVAADCALTYTDKFKWLDSTKKMIKIVEGVCNAVPSV